MYITTIPPLITQRFNSKLLLTPCPKFYEDSETLDRVFNYAYNLHLKKTKSGKIPSKKKKGQELIYEYQELYERIKAKEEELKAKGKDLHKRLFYRIGGIGKKGEKIFGRAKYFRK